MSKIKIDDKIREIEKYLEELTSIIPRSFREYKEDFAKKAACERYLERIVEAVTDLAFLIIKELSFKTPEEDKQSFDILASEQVITTDLAERLKDAKGMRNILAHQYGIIDDEIVFHSITEELIDDLTEFISNIKKILP